LPDIHPTAIIDPQAQLHDRVRVGPGCCITGPVTVGADTVIHAYAQLQGPMTIGSGNTVYPFCCLGLPPQDKSFQPGDPTPGVVIGDRNVIREYGTVHAATRDQPTRLGDDNYLMLGTHIGHDSQVGSRCVMVNRVSIGGHSIVEDNVNISGHAGTHQFSRIGRYCLISGGMAVTQDVPPFCTLFPNRTIGSLNLVGLRRAGLRQHIKPLGLAFRVLADKHHTTETRAQLIHEACGDDPLCNELVAFFSKSKRGVFRFSRQRTGRGE